MAALEISRSSMSEQEKNTRKRRLSNLFNPSEIFSEDILIGEHINEEISPTKYEITVETPVEEANRSLEADLSSLDQNEDINVEMEDGEPVKLRRSQRRKIRTTLPEEPPRVVTKSIKLHENSSLKDIKNYYLDKKVKRLNLSLETIYEEPQAIGDEDVVMSTRKFKRTIDFSTNVSKINSKIRKRKVKIKNMKTSKKLKKISMKYFMEKLDELEED